LDREWLLRIALCDDWIRNVCFPLRQSRASFPWHAALIAAARDIALGVAQANVAACLSDVRASADRADRFIDSFGPRRAAPHAGLIYPEPRGIGLDGVPSPLARFLVVQRFTRERTPMISSNRSIRHTRPERRQSPSRHRDDL
jgi:hypothetical protein